MSHSGALLPAALEVPFNQINAALQRAGDQTVAARARSLMATVVAIGPVERLLEPAEALQEIGEGYAVRAILISQGSDPAPPVKVAGHAIAIRGLKASYVDNAVAALRLSSLPTLVWFRGGTSEMLEDLAKLSDRLVLDEEEPRVSWQRALNLLDRTAFSDLRWTRLTRWRTLMAHFFDIPQVRAAAQSFTRLRVSGSDPVAASLYAGWVQTSLPLTLEVELGGHPGGPPIDEIRLGGASQHLTLRLAPSGTCVHTAAVVDGHRSTSRTVSLGDQRLPVLIAEELRIRARDLAFERAIAACVGRP